MKGKFIAIFLIIAFALSMCVGCDVITKNDERDSKQVMVEVNYGGLSSAVTKADIIEAYNSYGYYYTMYYGYTVTETVDLLVESLSNRQLLLLYVRCELAKAKGLSSDTDIVNLLTPAEIDNAIKETNTTMQSWYDTIVEELEKEAATEDDEVTDDEDKEEDEEKEDVLEPRPVRPADAEAKFDPNATVETFTKKFFDEGYDYGHKDSEFITKALADLKSDLEKNYRNYDYYLNKNYESAVLSNWQRTLSNGFTVSDALLEAEYNSYIKKNQEAFAADNNSSYSTAITSSLTSTLYHPVKGYGYVYNILLKFSDEQTAALKQLTASGNVSDENVKAYRALLAQEIKVNVSNLAYDPDYKDCEECAAHAEDSKNPVCEDPKCPAKPYERENVPVATILDEIFTSFEAISNDVTLNDFQKFTALREKATEWVYMVNDDSGMYDKESSAISNSGNGYLITPDGEKSDYVTEFTDLGRDLIKKGLGTYTTADATDSREDKIKGMYCVTDYGIHIMFVSYIPYDEKAIDKEGNPLTVENGILPLDYVVSYGRYGSEVTLDKSFRDIFVDALKTANENDVYTIASQAFIKNNKDSSIKLKEKKIEKIVKLIEENKG